jgi:carboxypeptidase PM20D1
MALLGLIEGLIFNDLANKVAMYFTYTGDRNWVAIVHLGFCFAILIRVIQTYITAALFYRKFLRISEIIIMTGIGLLQHLLADSVRDPTPSGPAVDFSVFYVSTLLICLLGAAGYLLTLVGILRNFFNSSTDMNAPTDLLRTIRLQYSNISGLVLIAVLSGSVLHFSNPEQAPFRMILIPFLCSVALIANTVHSSRQSFLRRRRRGSTRRQDQPSPEEFLPAAQLLIDNFGYLFSQFLPIIRDGRKRARIHARLMAIVMTHKEGHHLLGWRAFRVVRENNKLAGIAVVCRPSDPNSSLLVTVLAFIHAIVLRFPLQLPHCLKRAYALRDILRPPRSMTEDMSILYITTDESLRHLGLGGQLLSDIELESRKQGAAGVIAGVREHNHDALNLFKRANYVEQPALGSRGLVFMRHSLPQKASGVQSSRRARPRRFRGWHLVVTAPVVLVACTASIRVIRTKSFQQHPFSNLKPFVSRVPLVNILEQVIRLRTISYEDNRADSAQAFTQMREVLRAAFPTTFHNMDPQDTPPGAQLLTLSGRNQDLDPILLYAHLDVVQADAEGWKHDPFSGFNDGTFLFGRGVFDDKLDVVTILGAFEALLVSGWRPERTIYVALGQDEENDGLGAVAVASLLQRKGIHLEMVLDEGSAIVDDKVPGIRRPIAAVAIAEKGYLDLELCTSGAEGHSSSPPDLTAVAIVSEAIERLSKRPPPRELNSLVRRTITYGAAEMTPGYRVVARNLWLTAPIVEKIMESNDVTRSLLGSTQAATIFNAGTKANVLPGEACAVINYRLFPGTDAANMTRRVDEIVHDPRVRIEAKGYTPAPVPSDLDSNPGQILSRVVLTEFPDAVVVPVVSPGTTDSRHFATITEEIFRFSPTHLSDGQLEAIHGVNERIRVSDVDKAFQFYCLFLLELGR